MPPLGVVVRYVAAGLLFCIALASTGLPRVWVWIGNATWLLLLVAAISGAPEMLPAFSQTLLGAALGAAILAAFSRSFVSMLGRRRLAPSISPVVLAAATIGFAAWFLTTASPLYEGGHFAYHTSISEEIWQGEFLLYYLPYPGSMLSRQPQWANLIVPHSCLFHTLASPLAAFPQAWFYPFTKAFLASLLFGIAVVCGLVATELGGKQAGSWAAAAAVASPTGFQLLGLGHLMTLFGCWAAALALGFILLHLPRLTERGIWWSAVGLVTWCNLSYTGSLLFASMTLAAASVLLIRVDPRLARRLALLLVAGWGAALILYYGHWVVPFLRETLPALAGGSGSDATIDIGARLAAFPAKLSYTFGSPILPVLGLAGVALVPRRPERLLLACWACVLVFVGAFDVVFNFLLKHHYYVFPALCIGLGLCLSSLQKKGRWGGWIAIAFFVYVGVTGIHEAMRTLTAP